MSATVECASRGWRKVTLPLVFFHWRPVLQCLRFQGVWQFRSVKLTLAYLCEILWSHLRLRCFCAMWKCFSVNKRTNVLKSWRSGSCEKMWFELKTFSAYVLKVGFTDPRQRQNWCLGSSKWQKLRNQEWRTGWKYVHSKAMKLYLSSVPWVCCLVLFYSPSYLGVLSISVRVVSKLIVA